MPFVQIELRDQFTKVEETLIMNAVHRALHEAFKRSDDISIKLLVHEPQGFMHPLDLKHPE